MSDARVLVGSCAAALHELPDASVHACVTSPPYFRLREYDAVAHWPEVTYTPMPGLAPVTIPAQECELGLEDDVSAYVGHLVHVFRCVHRVLRDDGTLWLNLGDTWAASGKRGGTRSGFNERWHGRPESSSGRPARTEGHVPDPRIPTGLKRKDLIGVPWRVAFALQADGWWLRSEICWEKPNALPDPTEDRLTKAHETVFQLAKSDLYFHDPHAIREGHTMRPQRRPNGHKRRRPGTLLPEHTWSGTARDEPGVDGHPLGRNARTVWKISTTPFSDAHFAVMPVELARRCVVASTSAKGVCPACASPWRRVVDRGDSSTERRRADGHMPDTGRYGLKGTAQGKRGATLSLRDDRQAGGLGVSAPQVLVGWEPSCSCDAGDPVPATVLDPFSGAATTGVAALREGRHFVGVEINTAFAEMSRRRLRDDAAQGVMFTGDGTLAPRG